MAAVSKDELQTDIADLKARLAQLDADNAGARFTDEVRDEWNRLNEELDEKERTLEEIVVRETRLIELAGKPEHLETAEFHVPRARASRGEDIWDLSGLRRQWDNPEAEARDLRDRSLRAIDQSRFPHQRANREDCQGHLERLTEELNDELSSFSRYLLTTGSPQYKRAFVKYLGGQQRTPDEEQLLIRATQYVNRAASLTAGSGGYAVPYVLDPTVLPTSSGAINPYRAISSVTSISVDEWRGVTSTGITAAFAAEAAAATDAAPTLTQPTVSTEKAFAFVPFSIEIGQDWANFSGEMANMIQDSKDILEASKFAVGTGTNEPFGVITGATTVYTASNTNSIVVADVYGVHNALGPRFRSNAVWTFNNAIADRIRQLDTAGGANLWVANLQLRSAAVVTSFTDGRMGADLLGHPVYEATGQSGAVTTGQLVGVIGDFSRYFKIVDRVGLTIETIPHLFGAAQGNLPTGQRGLYAFWRVGSKVLDAAAFRVLRMA